MAHRLNLQTPRYCNWLLKSYHLFHTIKDVTEFETHILCFIVSFVSQDAEEWRTNSEKIRLKADAVFHKIQACFTVPEGDSFWDAFEKAVVEFRDVTKGLDRSQVLHMVADPTTKVLYRFQMTLKT